MVTNANALCTVSKGAAWAPSCAANHSWCQGDPENLLDIVKGPANQVRALFHLTKLVSTRTSGLARVRGDSTGDDSLVVEYNFFFSAWICFRKVLVLVAD